MQTSFTGSKPSSVQGSPSGKQVKQTALSIIVLLQPAPGVQESVVQISPSSQISGREVQPFPATPGLQSLIVHGSPSSHEEGQRQVCPQAQKPRQLIPHGLTGAKRQAKERMEGNKVARVANEPTLKTRSFSPGKIQPLKELIEFAASLTPITITSTGSRRISWQEAKKSGVPTVFRPSVK